MQQEQKRIMARFRPQAWIGDEATDIDDGQSDFDVTRLIAALPLRELRQIKDNRHSSDDLAYCAGLLRGHSGPFVVEVEDALRAYFGVESLDDITQSQLDALRRQCPGEESVFRTDQINTEPMVVLSTAHLPEAEAKALTEAIASKRVNGMQRDEGWLIHARQTLGAGFAVLDELLQRARNSGVQWLLFDRDAGALDNLTVFDW